MEIDSTNPYPELQGIAPVLRSVFLSALGEVMIHTFVENGLDDTWPELTGSEANHQGKTLLTSFSSQWNLELLTELKLDYGQLFVGLGGLTVIPRGLVYLSEQLLFNDKLTLALKARHIPRQAIFNLDHQ
ncbi:molecular chaperone TorD family protein [Shewanella sp. D64]|uniref:molecular chaperone TorD family protein n=1 Tax=unclassified Shewanella TaxID=196818 RepID=UPI0022BA3FC5|nr:MULTISPECIES: molecular chaperone TorD family protein [unclassified Shewanella]MEC4728661.1 molecular chaperone TorD family protein [Shewanella sp. D64]MEC4740576.1 molecular chaperone TorD family protein [Shewanella sp. E94]WBJ95115.1 molecular chaperone TorD family protein [Shewanella sp. MTB7]